MSHCNILEMKLGNYKLWNPELWYLNKEKIVIEQMGYVGHNQRR